jgi:hypothetical protein
MRKEEQREVGQQSYGRMNSANPKIGTSQQRSLADDDDDLN